jgi:hypothetical protein
MSTTELAAVLAKKDQFNTVHPVGTTVRYWIGARVGEGTVAKTRCRAWVMSGSARVYVEGHGRAVELALVEVVGEAEAVPEVPEPIIGVCNRGNWNGELHAFTIGDYVCIQFGDEDESFNPDFCMPPEGARELARRLLVLADEVDAALLLPARRGGGG